MTSITVQPANQNSLDSERKELEEGIVKLPSLSQITKKLTTRDGWLGEYGKLTILTKRFKV